MLKGLRNYWQRYDTPLHGLCPHGPFKEGIKEWSVRTQTTEKAPIVGLLIHAQKWGAATGAAGSNAHISVTWFRFFFCKVQTQLLQEQKP